MLEIFPSAFVDNSLLTAVLVGVLVLWWLAERFGWPATGLVVPGYLGAVLSVRPEAGFVILFEAVITYGLAHLIGRVLPKFLPIDRVFGRDRFFLIILCSIFVRIVIEGGVGQALLGKVGLGVSSGWHSLGLVLVPLAANALWNRGLGRGLPIMGIPVLVVFGLFTFILLPFTNLDFGQFELTYEDLRFSFLESPREYILVLLGALVASHTTARFGWDFGGIIVCGLLAISWLSPLKLVSTLIEIVLIVGAMRLLTSIKPLKHANISGLRPIVLAFTLSYLIKLLISWVTQGAWPGFRAGEVFGFGYLLPAIISVRCWRKGRFSAVLVPALAISLGSCVVGQGAAMALVELRGGSRSAAQVTLVSQAEGPARRAVLDNLVPQPSDLRRVDEELYTGLAQARSGETWAGRRIQVDAFDDGAVLHSGDLGLVGTAWVRPSDQDLIEIIVPDAATDPGLAELGVVLAEELDAAVLLLSPTPELKRAAHRRGRLRLVLTTTDGPPLLRADRRVPTELDLEAISDLLPGFTTTFEVTGAAAELELEVPERELLRLALAGGFDLPVSQQRVPLWRDEAPMPTDNDPRGGLSVRQLSALDRGVVQPMLLAMDGGDARWLRLASSNAARMGMVVADDGEILALGPEDHRQPPRFTLWLRRGGEPVAIEVRAAGRNLHADQVGHGWWEQLDATALLVHDARADLDAEAMRRAGPPAPEVAILRDLAVSQEGLQVLAISVSREDEIPGADAVISRGRPMDPRFDPIDPLLWTAAGLVAQAGGTWTWYDGHEQRIRFYDPANPRRDAVKAAGGDYITVYLSQPFRLRYAGTEPDSILRALLDHAGIPVIDADLQRLLELPAADADARWDPVLDQLMAFRTTGHPGDLEVLRATAHSQGQTVEAFTDRATRVTYLRVQDGGQILIVPMGLSPDAGRIDIEHLPGPALPAVRVLPVVEETP